MRDLDEICPGYDKAAALPDPFGWTERHLFRSEGVPIAEIPRWVKGGSQIPRVLGCVNHSSLHPPASAAIATRTGSVIVKSQSDRNRMSQRTPFAPYPLAKSGDSEADRVYMAVGKALSLWEISEDSMAHVFNVLIRPSHPSAAADRAYLSIAAASARLEMIKEAGRAFFLFFPSDLAESEFNSLTKLYQNGCARRNEIAHGIVAAHIHPDSEGFADYYLGPHFKTHKKRTLNHQPKYLFSTRELSFFVEDVASLSAMAKAMTDSLTRVWRSADSAAQARY